MIQTFWKNLIISLVLAILVDISGPVHGGPTSPGESSADSIMNGDSNKAGVDTARTVDSTDSGSLIESMEQLVRNSIFKAERVYADTLIAGRFVESEKIFQLYTGYRINSIGFIKVDLIDGSIFDTTKTANSWLAKTANNLHIMTKDDVLSQNLLFAEGDLVDPYIMADSERILRSLPFIEDARIILRLDVDDAETVNVFVITKDVFSVGLSVTFKTVDRYDIRIYDRNFLGLGWELGNRFIIDNTSRLKVGHDFLFRVNNIEGTFIDGMLNYLRNFQEEKFNIGVSRPFISPDIKWGGAASISGEDYKEGIDQPYKTWKQDLWIGRSFIVGARERRQNFYISGRYYHKSFPERPFTDADSNSQFHEEHLLLGRLSFTRRNFYESSLILGFGHTEDVPFGYFASLTAGTRIGEFNDRMYAGISVGGADRLDGYGYLSVGVEYGSFFDSQYRMSEGLLDISTFYFSPLWSHKTFSIRQFIRVNYTQGYDRRPHESIDLVEPGPNIRFFPSHEIRGTKRLLTGFETVAFTPWYLLGFRFALFGFLDIAFIAPKDDALFEGGPYFGLGFGFRIMNESLVFETIEIQAAVYPKVPEESKQYKIKFSTKISDLFQILEIVKPRPLPFE